MEKLDYIDYLPRSFLCSRSDLTVRHSSSPPAGSSLVKPITQIDNKEK